MEFKHTVQIILVLSFVANGMPNQAVHFDSKLLETQHTSMKHTHINKKTKTTLS